VFLEGCSRSHDAAPTPSTPAVAQAPDSAAPVVANASAPDAAAFAEAAPTCDPSPGVFLFTSPMTPVAGAPLRVMAVSDKPLVGKLAVDAATSEVRRGGPPYFWIVETTAAATTNATFTQRACADTAAATSPVSVGKANASLSTGTGVWLARGT